MKPGPKPLSPEEHQRRGSYRRDRHGPDVTDDDSELEDVPEPVSDADRARVLRGLPPIAKAVATTLLDTYYDFDVSALFTLRQYALSCDRLTRLHDARTPNSKAIHAEIVINLALRRSLNLGEESS